MKKRRRPAQPISATSPSSPSCLLLTLAGTALCLVFLLGLSFLERRLFVYPPLHRQQSSPEEYIDTRLKTLPPGTVKPIVIAHGSRDTKYVALTFDADMTWSMYELLQKGAIKSWYNESVIDILKKEQAKATLFLGGLWVKSYPLVAKALALDPLFEIGNHSFSHPAFRGNCYHLPVIDDAHDVNEVLDAQNIIQQATGVTPKYFRFPGGCYDKIDLETIAKLGLTVVHWDVVAQDGFNTHTQSIVNAVVPRVQNGSIVVFHMHDGAYAPQTDEALTQIIPLLRGKGYTFVTISELLAQ